MEHAESLARSFSWRKAVLGFALVLVVLLAAVGGVALLQRHEQAAPASTRPVSDTTGAGPARQVAATPLRPRSRVPVLILNGNGISGAAGDEASQLLKRGYRRTTAANATTGYATSLVLFRPGWEREAKRLARDTGIRTVAALDGTLPSPDAGYRLVLILGSS